jgi:hypothetical protein
MQLAKLRGLPISRALALTDAVKVDRPNLRPALEAQVHTGNDVVAGREAVQNARDQIGAMVELDSSLLDQVQGSTSRRASTAFPAASRAATTGRNFHS